MQLSNRHCIPQLGLGTWFLAPKDVETVLTKAIQIGYRHIDCSPVYENQKEIGSALQRIFASNLVKREDLFITSKLWSTEHHPSDAANALERTLQDLQLDYLDLYLVHWPFALKKQANEVSAKDSSGKFIFEDIPLTETWSVMEDFYQSGKVRAIGVSNCCIKKLEMLLSNPKLRVKPMMNQVEMNPLLPQNNLLEYCTKNSICVTAYSPLGSRRGTEHLLNNPIVKSVAEIEKLTPAQVLIAWALSRNTVVIPKTSHLNRLEENFCSDLRLSKESMAEIAKIKERYRAVDPSVIFGLECFDNDDE